MVNGLAEIRVLMSIEGLLGKRVEEQLKTIPQAKVVGHASRRSEMLVLAREFLPDLVLLTGEEDDSMPGVCTHLFCELPEVVVVAVAPGGHDAIVFRQCTSARKIEGIMSQGLKSVVNSVISTVLPNDAS